VKGSLFSSSTRIKTFLAFLLAFVILSGCIQPELVPPVVNISPANPQESDFQNQYSTFKLVATISDSNFGDQAISYSYQWLKNGELINGATSNELPASLMGTQGHTIRGYEFECQVTASDSNGNEAEGSAGVTIGGSSLAVEGCGCRFSNFFRGSGQIEPAKLSSLDAMKEHTNANWVSIGMGYFQDSVNATYIYEKGGIEPIDSGEISTISESDLISQIEYAHSLGLKVMLYPEICINGCGWPGPRDQITGSPEWFAAYQTKMVHLADYANVTEVEMFCVGVELWGTEGKEQSWRQLIQEVKKHYSGPVIYATNYLAQGHESQANDIKWLDAVDYIGATGPFETGSDNKDPTISELKGYYSQQREVLHQLSTKFNKPLIVTEIGAPSVDGFTTNYWIASSTPDLQEHADFYEAVFETFANQPWVSGVFAIDWFPTSEQWYQDDPAWPISTAFLNKPAERVIRSWFTK